MLSLSKIVLALLLVLAAGAGATATVLFRPAVAPGVPSLALVPTCTPPAAAIEADRKWREAKVQRTPAKEF